jgi:signal transduction histidine kinase
VEDVALLASVADHTAVAVENARLHEQNELLAVAQERKRLARELHDSITQSLYSVGLFADTGLELARASHHEPVREYLSRIATTAQLALAEMRLMVYQLRPTALGDLGLVRALRHRLDSVEERSGIEATLLVEGDIDLNARAEEALFGIAQETLNNVLRHSGASAVTVRLRGERGRTELEVVDDGRGFNPDLAAAAGGLGLTTMRERAERIGGTLTISAAPGEGTVVRASVPSATAGPSSSGAGQPRQGPGSEPVRWGRRND